MEILKNRGLIINYKKYNMHYRSKVYYLKSLKKKFLKNLKNIKINLK